MTDAGRPALCQVECGHSQTGRAAFRFSQFNALPTLPAFSCRHCSATSRVTLVMFAASSFPMRVARARAISGESCCRLCASGRGSGCGLCCGLCCRLCCGLCCCGLCCRPGRGPAPSDDMGTSSSGASSRAASGAASEAPPGAVSGASSRAASGAASGASSGVDCSCRAARCDAIASRARRISWGSPSPMMSDKRRSNT